jgi:thioredoxin-like negative regulator of GroEL
MKNLTSLAEMHEIIAAEGFVLFYLSKPDCGVCKALKPKVEAMLDENPFMKAYYADLSAYPEIGGQFSVFTIPGILIFVNGKETIREARYIAMDQLRAKIERIRQLAFS